MGCSILVIHNNIMRAKSLTIILLWRRRGMQIFFSQDQIPHMLEIFSIGQQTFQGEHLNKMGVA
jgi:hypothetical protein